MPESPEIPHAVLRMAAFIRFCYISPSLLGVEHACPSIRDPKDLRTFQHFILGKHPLIAFLPPLENLFILLLWAGGCGGGRGEIMGG